MKALSEYVYVPNWLRGYNPKNEKNCTKLSEFTTSYATVYSAQYRVNNQGCDAFIYKPQEINTSNIDDQDIAQSTQKLFLSFLSSVVTIPPHPCIQQFYAYSLQDLFFITEPVEHTFYTHLQGPDADLAKLNQFDETQKSIFAFALACTLMHLHASEMIHRDINPITLGVDENLLPKLTSFFQSRSQNRANVSFKPSANGTDVFVAPEVFEGVDGGTKVDIFSYGMVLYSLLIGAVPRRPPPPPNLRFYQALPDIKNDPKYQTINSLIQRCWEEDPDDRPSSVDIVLHLRNVGPLFPDTDLNEYNQVTKQIFDASKKPENDEKRFSEDFRIQYQTLTEKIQSGNATKVDFVNIGTMHKHGYGCPKNLQLAVSTFKPLADSGNAFAIDKLSRIYLEAESSSSKSSFNPAKEAEYYLKKLYDFNNDAFRNSNLDLARLYATKYAQLGLTLEQGLDKSIKIENELLQSGKLEQYKANIQHFLANDYVLLADTKFRNDPNQISQLYLNAIALFEESSKTIKDSIPLLVDIYLKLNERQKAIDKITIARKSPNPTGDILFKYGELCERGIISIKGKRNFMEALRAYEAAIREGHIIAMRKAALIYEKLDKFNQDFETRKNIPEKKKKTFKS